MAHSVQATVGVARQKEDILRKKLEHMSRKVNADVSIYPYFVNDDIPQPTTLK